MNDCEVFWTKQLTLCIAEGGEIELPPLGSKLDEVK